MGTGGISIQADGTEAPLSVEELQEHLNMPDVEYEEDGSVWVYYQNQKLEITDKFTDGVCYVKLEGKIRRCTYVKQRSARISIYAGMGANHLKYALHPRFFHYIRNGG